MKKISYILLTLFVSLFIQAQDAPKFGLNAGSTSSDLRGSTYGDELKPAINYLVGISMEVPLKDRLSFSVSINYERKTASQKIEYKYYLDQVPDPNDPAFGDVKFKVKTTLHYLAIPLSLKYYIGSKNNFYLNGGLFAAFKIDETFRYNSKKGDSPANGDYKNFDFGLSFGVGTRIKLSEKQNLNIEIRNNVGLKNVSNIIYYYGGSQALRTNSINLVANWQFDL